MPCSLQTPNASTIFCDDCGKGPCSQIAPNGAIPQPRPRVRIDVNTRDLTDLDSAPKVRRIDWDHTGREWLISHLTWALKTGKSVTLSPAEG